VVDGIRDKDQGEKITYVTLTSRSSFGRANGKAKKSEGGKGERAEGRKTKEGKTGKVEAFRSQRP